MVHRTLENSLAKVEKGSVQWSTKVYRDDDPEAGFGKREATMESQEILERARAGDPKIIAAVLNHSLKPLGIQTQAAKSDRTLHIVLEANPTPNPGQTTLAVRRLMTELGVQGLDQIILYGQQSGEESVAWKQDIALPLALTTDLTPVTPISDFQSSPETQAAPEPQTLETTPVPPTDPSDPAPTAPAAPPGMEASADPTALEADIVSEGREPNLAIAPPAEMAPSPNTDASLQSRLTALQRPEAVILILFLVVVTFWELYLDLAAADESTSLSGARLASRLAVSPSTISRRKLQDDFSEWSQSLDPEGIAWFYENGRFWPLIPTAESAL